MKCRAAPQVASSRATGVLYLSLVLSFFPPFWATFLSKIETCSRLHPRGQLLLQMAIGREVVRVGLRPVYWHPGASRLRSLPVKVDLSAPNSPLASRAAPRRSVTMPRTGRTHMYPLGADRVAKRRCIDSVKLPRARPRRKELNISLPYTVLPDGRPNPGLSKFEYLRRIVKVDYCDPIYGRIETNDVVVNHVMRRSRH